MPYCRGYLRGAPDHGWEREAAAAATLERNMLERWVTRGGEGGGWCLGDDGGGRRRKESDDGSGRRRVRRSWAMGRGKGGQAHSRRRRLSATELGIKGVVVGGNW